MLKSSLIFLLVLTTVIAKYGVWRGKVFYHDTFNSHQSYFTSKRYCAANGGQLPSIHSQYDINEIRQIVGSGAIWLGAPSRNNTNLTRDEIINKPIEWMDGTPFDFNKMDDEVCTSSCCALVLHDSDELLMEIPCSSSTNSITKIFCVYPYWTEQIVKFYFSLHSSRYNSSHRLVPEFGEIFNTHEKMKTEMKQLNETLYDLKLNLTKHLADKDD